MQNKIEETVIKKSFARKALLGVIGATIAILFCWALKEAYNADREVERKVQVWESEYRKNGVPFNVEIGEKNPATCSTVLWKARSLGFIIEIDGHAAESERDLMEACRWFHGNPTATLSKNEKWWQYR